MRGEYYIYILLLLQLVSAIFVLHRVKNNTIVGLGADGFEDNSDIYAGNEKLWTDMTAFILPKGSPLMASAKLIFLIFLCTFKLAINFAE